MAPVNRTTKPANTPRRAETRREHLERVNRALVYVESRLTGDLSLERVAGHVSMSPFHFQRAFAAVVGETPAGYVRRLRLEAAATVLMRGWSVPRALHAEVGYARAEPFIRAFKKRFGVTPTEYRRRRATGRVGRAPSGMRAWENRAEGTDVLRMSPGPVRAGQSCVMAGRFGPVRAAFIRCVGEGGEGEDWRAAMRRLLAWAWVHGRISTEPLCMLMVHDDADVTSAERRRVDCCVVVSPRTRASGEVGIRLIPQGTYAIGTVEGSDAMVRKGEAWVARAAEQETRKPLGVGARLRVVLPPGPRRGGGQRELTDVLVPLKCDEDLMQIYFRRVRGEWTVDEMNANQKRSRA